VTALAFVAGYHAKTAWGRATSEEFVYEDCAACDGGPPPSIDPVELDPIPVPIEDLVPGQSRAPSTTNTGAGRTVHETAGPQAVARSRRGDSILLPRCCLTRARASHPRKCKGALYAKSSLSAGRTSNSLCAVSLRSVPHPLSSNWALQERGLGFPGILCARLRGAVCICVSNREPNAVWSVSRDDPRLRRTNLSSIIMIDSV
jgi:hypothetical protein